MRFIHIKRIPLWLKTSYDVMSGSKRGAGGGEVRPAAIVVGSQFEV
jgi:hypothetical protein